MRPRPGENDRVNKGLGLRLHLPDNGAVARSLLGVLVLTAAALLWGPAGAATSTAAAGAIAGAIALQDNPLGRIPIVLAISVELGIAVLAGGLSAGYSVVFVIVIALWCFFAGMQWAVGAPAGLLAGASGLLLVIQHPQPASGGIGIRPVRRRRRSDAGRAHRGVAAAALAARARSADQGLPVVECRRAAAGHRAGAEVDSSQLLGVQGSVQQQRDPVRPAHTGIPGLACAARTDRQDADGVAGQGRRAGRDP